MVFASLFECAFGGNFDEFERLLCESKDAINLDETNQNGDTLVHAAVYGNGIEIIDMLYDYGANTNIRNNHQDAALHWAIEYNKYYIVVQLLECGADPNLYNGNGLSPLHCAITRQICHQILVVEELIQYGANVNAIDNMGNSVLYYAINNRCPVLVGMLLDNGATLGNLLDGLNDYRIGVLHLLSCSHAYNIMYRYLSDGFGIDTPDSMGCTPLHYAARYGKVYTVRFLLLCGADINYINVYSETPLIYAARNGHFDVVQYLLTEGANMDIAKVDGRKFRDFATSEMLDFVEELRFAKRLAGIKFLMETGDDTCIRDYNLLSIVSRFAGA